MQLWLGGALNGRSQKPVTSPTIPDSWVQYKTFGLKIWFIAWKKARAIGKLLFTAFLHVSLWDIRDFDARLATNWLIAGKQAIADAYIPHGRWRSTSCASFGKNFFARSRQVTELWRHHYRRAHVKMAFTHVYRGNMLWFDTEQCHMVYLGWFWGQGHLKVNSGHVKSK